jgi:hypothetical protein
VSEEDYDYVFDTNVKGAFFVAQEVGKRMLARARGAAPGTYTGGRIINIASMAGLRALPQIGVYAMSKAAVIHMTKALALEWGRFGINVNALCPGYIDTEINHHHWDTEQGQKLVNMLPRKRVGKPEDLDGADRAAGVRPEPLRQRRGDRRRRRLRALTPRAHADRALPPAAARARSGDWCSWRRAWWALRHGRHHAGALRRLRRRLGTGGWAAGCRRAARRAPGAGGAGAQRARLQRLLPAAGLRHRSGGHRGAQPDHRHHPVWVMLLGKPGACTWRALVPGLVLTAPGSH